MGSKKVKSKSEEKRIKGLLNLSQELTSKELADAVSKVTASSTPLTGIYYKPLPGDKVIITGFYGFLTLKEIEEQCGENILHAYESNDCRVVLQYACDGKERLRLSDGNCEDRFDTIDVCVGDIFTKDEFSEIIKHIRKCGKYLHDLKVAMKLEEKVIGI